MSDPKIHPVFERLMPTLLNVESDQLEQNIKDDGRILEAIELWRGFVVDGHHRHKIANKLHMTPGVDYHFTHLPASMTEDEVCEYILTKQVGRRNLSTELMDDIILKLHEIAESNRPSLRNPKSQPQACGKTGKSGNIARDVAAKTGVSESTVHGKVSKAKKIIASLPKHVKIHVEKEGATATELAVLDECADIHEVESSLKSGQTETFREAYQEVTGKPIKKSRKKKVAKTVVQVPLSKRLNGLSQSIQSITKTLDVIVRDRKESWVKSHHRAAITGLDKAYQELAKWTKKLGDGE